jgi:hypothetical protein
MSGIAATRCDLCFEHASKSSTITVDNWNVHTTSEGLIMIPHAILIGASLALAASSSSAAFYVSTSGNDSADGSSAHPFATLKRAVSAMERSSTHTTYLAGGKYYISSTVNLGSADSGMTIQSTPGSAAVLDGRGSLSTLIQLNGATGVTLKGLTFQYTGSNSAAVLLNNAHNATIVGNLFSHTGEGLRLQGGSSSNFVSGNEFDNSSTSAVEVQNNSNNNQFDSNHINGTGAIGTKGGGFLLHGANYNVISHNLVENTAGVGIGIENWDSTTVNVGNSVTYNTLHNTSASAASTDSGAIYMLGRSHVDTKTVINGNYISGAPQPFRSGSYIVGIYLDDLTSGVTATNNIVATTISRSFQIHGGFNITIRNNIFDLGPNSGRVYGQAPAILFQSQSGYAMTGISVTQNIITSTSPTPIAYSSISGGNPTINNNFYMDLVNSHFQLIGSYLPNTNAHSGNARFVNQAGGNYALGSNSGAFSIGFSSINQSAMGLHPTTVHWY